MERKLSLEEMKKVTGGVLDDTAKDYIASFISVYKEQGSDKSILNTTGWSEEFLKYALQIWDSVK